jgi:NAD(P)-dependent dehydrogenase (short-subunit alcohol dehydrogenase family)
LESTDFSQGISQATAVSFAREGCTKIVLADRDEKGLETTQRLINEVAGYGKAEILAVKTDVTSAEQIDHLVQTAVKQFGRIDYAVNGAGNHIDSLDSFVGLELD